MPFVHLLPAPLHYANYECVLATCFFLGILFSLFPYDYPLIWTAASPSEVYLQTLETHLRFLHASPPIVPRILHIVMAVGLLGFFIKLYRPSESNMLFDGASLVLYMCGFVVYMANIVSGLRVVTNGKYDVDVTQSEGSAGVKDGAQSEGKPLGRADSLKVLAASNTILALVLVGVLILQAGQWYAERKESQELESIKGDKSVTTKGNGNTYKVSSGKKKA